MQRSVAKIKGVAFIFWHAKHELFHVLLGLMWAWFLREMWNEFNIQWILIAIFGSLLPDIEHITYLFGYGKHDPYAKNILAMLKKRQWRTLAVFVHRGHKYNTNLRYHNYYFMLLLFALGIVSFFIHWNVGIILFGSMLTHYCFDIIEDIILLGRINPNWKRWGRGEGYTDTTKIQHPAGS